MNYFSSIYGLVTKNDPVTENGGLFLAYYYVLKKMNGHKISTNERILYIEKMGRAYVAKGLYKRSQAHNERTVSHDEITGMIISSLMIVTVHRHDILDYLFSHWGNYPATGKRKFYQPSDYFAWLTMTHSPLAILFFPFYLISLLISSNKKSQETSSKLIYLSELHTMKDFSFLANLLWKYFSWRMNKMYGSKWVESLFLIYFHTEDDDHPLKQLSRGIIL